MKHNHSRILHKITLLSLVCLAIASLVYLAVAKTSLPSDVPLIPMATNCILVDGDDSEWNSYRIDFLGLGTPFEHLLGAERKLSWTEDGIFLGLRLNRSSVEGPPTESLFLDLFLDCRPFDCDKRWEYNSGVSWFRFDVRRAVDQTIAGLSMRGSFRSDGDPICRAKCIGQNLVIEVKIGAGSLNRLKLSSGSEFGLGCRLRLEGEYYHSETGIIDIDNNVGPENNPETFDLLKLSNLPSVPKETICKIEEAVSNGVFGLQLELVSRVPPPTLPLKVTVGGELKQVEFTAVTVADGRFPKVRSFIPLGKYDKDNILVVVAKEDDILENQKLSLRMPSRLRRLETTLPLATTVSEDTPKNLLLELLRDAAIETIRRLQVADDGIRPLQRRYRDRRNPKQIDTELDQIIEIAQKVHTTGNASFRNAELMAWRRPDGVVSPVWIDFPISDVPHKDFPLLIDLHGLNRYLTRAVFLTKRLAEQKQREKTANLPKYYRVYSFGAGNNYELAAKDEIEHIISWSAENLGIDRACVGLIGHSYGGTMALRLASRIPSLFATVEARSADISTALSAPSADLEKSQELYDLSLPSVLGNLSSLGIRLVVGELDEVVKGMNEDFTANLRFSGQQIDLVILPKVGHTFNAEQLAPLNPAEFHLPNDSRRPFHFSCRDLRFSNAYGVTILAQNEKDHESRFTLLPNDKCLTITTENVKALRLEKDPMFRYRRTGAIVVIDGQSIDLDASGLDLILNDGRWSKGKVNQLWKTVGSCGPAVAITPRPFLVVYGTRMPGMTNTLRERSRDIARQFTGNRIFEWSGRVVTVLSDEEARTQCRQTHDLYLVGTPEENGLTNTLGSRALFDWARLCSQYLNLCTDNEALSLQYIMPNPDADGKYLFLEMGSRPGAYCGPAMRAPNFDYSIAKKGRSWTTLEADYFDCQWRKSPSVFAAGTW